MTGLLGRKVGMTRIFTENGASIPVTVIEVGDNRVAQVKSTDTKDGYNAIQLVAGSVKPGRVSRPLAGHYAKAGIEPGDLRCEFRVVDPEDFKPGQSLTVSEVFTEGQLVDVESTSKGKGYAGTVKRHNFRTQDATHGNSVSHRVPGSIGQNQTPGRVFKGKKMSGHMGNVRCSVQNLQVVKIDQERSLMLVKGAIPGCPGERVEIKPSVKSRQRG